MRLLIPLHKTTSMSSMLLFWMRLTKTMTILKMTHFPRCQQLDGMDSFREPRLSEGEGEEDGSSSTFADRMPQIDSLQIILTQESEPKSRVNVSDLSEAY